MGKRGWVWLLVVGLGVQACAATRQLGPQEDEAGDEGGDGDRAATPPAGEWAPGQRETPPDGDLPVAGQPGDGDPGLRPDEPQGDGDFVQGDGDWAVDSGQWVEPNLDCPESPPFTGPGAPSGACCYRGQPNSLRVRRAPDGLVTTEYRLNYDVVTNHPNSMGLPALIGLAINRNDNHEQNLLFRFEHPRRDGRPDSGYGYFWRGVGVYNCDGTYSFFSDDAAPVRSGFPGADDRGRFEALQMGAGYDATVNHAGRLVVRFEDDYRGRSYIPFLDADTFALDWELIAQGFAFGRMSFAEDSLDCVGERRGSAWAPGGTYSSYFSVEDNHHAENGIPVLAGQTLSQLVAYGLLSGEDVLLARDPTDVASRCAPELDLPVPDRTCPWIKLPDSLCPVSDAEREAYGCRLGWEDNPDGLDVVCSPAPSTNTNGFPQCCSPFGEDGLPVCNAWIVQSEFVAASAQIDETPSSSLPGRCQ